MRFVLKYSNKFLSKSPSKSIPRKMVLVDPRASHPSSHTAGFCLLQFEKLALNWLLSKRESGEQGEGGRGSLAGLFVHREGCYKNSHMGEDEAGPQ